MDGRRGDARDSEVGNWRVKKTLAFPANRSILGAQLDAEDVGRNCFGSAVADPGRFVVGHDRGSPKPTLAPSVGLHASLA
jgi:hypothetical protein